MKTILTGKDYNDIFLFADSCSGRDVMPLFIPDFAPEGGSSRWLCQIALAFRVGRLGKNVTEKFAARYVDAVGAVALLLPAIANGEAPANCQLPSWLGIMDNTVTTGKWLPLPEEPITMAYGDKEVEVSNPAECVAQALAQVTSIATIKTGDLIVPALPRIDLPLVVDSRASVAINGEEALLLKIK